MSSYTQPDPASPSLQDVSIAKALTSQEDLKRRAEHCSADPRLLASISSERGHQVRIVRSSEEYALYTVSEARPEGADVVRMGLVGRRRLGTDGEFDAVLDSRVPHPTFSDDDARAGGELVERLQDDGRHSGLIAIAPHGGNIEPRTDEQAERVVSRLAAHAVSSWSCKGFKPGGEAFERWHITSTDISEASFPLLNCVIGRGFAHAVAFHGFAGPDILIGGTADEGLKQEIKAAIEAATAGSGIAVRVALPDERFGGDDPRNVVNRLTADGAGGIQIEQPADARARHHLDIADAVSDVYARRLELSTEGLR